MKRQKRLLMWIAGSLLMLLSITSWATNPTYTCKIANQIQVSCNMYEFDVMLMRTGGTVFTLAQYQLGITINPNIIPAGGVINVYPIAGTSTLNKAANIAGPEKFSYVPEANLIKVTPVAPTGSPTTSSTIINTGSGTKLFRLRVACTLPFVTGTNPNHAWNFVQVTPLYPTKIFAYVGTVNTDITNPAGTVHSVNTTPLITFGTSFSDPVPQEVTTNNPTPCPLPGLGATISLTTTEAGKSYYLYVDGVQVPGVGGVAFGTGTGVDFGTLVSGNVISVKSPNCAGGMTDMANDVLMTPSTALTASVSITYAPTANPGEYLFTANPVNGGEPGYAWFIGTTSQEIFDPTFTYTPTDGDLIKVEMYSSESCVTPTTAIGTLSWPPVIPATADAGVDQTICALGTATLAGAFGGCATGATWSGGGSFAPDANAMDAVFTPTPAQIAAGYADLTLTTTGCTPVATDIVRINLTAPTVPTFDPQGPYCVGDAGSLPAASTNGIAGSWSPAFSTASAGLTNYLFTPTAGQCATTAILSITVTAPVASTFNPQGPYCVGDVASLPATSTQGNAGTWSPAFSTASAGTTLYTFTPSVACVSPGTLSITVNDPVVATFDPMGPFCQNSSAPALPTLSKEGFTGSWSPATINTAALGLTVYTFTPTAGQCASAGTLSITISTPVTPLFDPQGPYCVGDAGSLPAQSTNGINGTWSPAFSTAAAGNTDYTFTPNEGVCATTAHLFIDVIAPTTPTFNPQGPYCVGEVASLPPTSIEGITGTWSPAFSTASAGTTNYLFTPTVGLCATTGNLSITVTAPVASTFNPQGPYCMGETASLPATSLEGTAGTWSPAFSTMVPGTTVYTFTPSIACAIAGTLSITINEGPGGAGVITGVSTVVPGTLGVPYSVAPIANATSYNWVYSGLGATIHGTGPAVTIDFTAGATSGQLSVQGQNSCGLGVPSSFFDIFLEVPCSGTSTWNGSVSNNWSVAANWTPAGVPCPTTEVIIPSIGITNFPTLGELATVASIKLLSGASFIGSEFLTTGIAKVEQLFPVPGYHYIGSPIESTGNTFGSVFQLNQTQVWAYKYFEPTGFWLNQTIANAVDWKVGYNVKMNTPQLAKFEGQFVQSNVPSVNLSMLNTATNPARRGWNLLGNPYPSGLKWSEVIGTGFDASVSVWNGSVYLAYNPSTGGVPGFLDGIIPSTNGFMVKASVNNATLIMPFAARAHNNKDFFKESVANLLTLRADANNYYDGALVNFNDNATSGFDSQFDAYKLQGIDEAPALYSMITGDILSINSLPMEGNEVVDLGFKCGVNGTYTISASGMESFDATTPIWLEDLKTGALQNLRNNATYSFSYTTTDNEKRFKLHFKSAFSVPENSLSGVTIYSATSTVVIKNTTKLAGEVKIYDLAGRELLHTSMSSQNETRIPVQFAVGTYMVKVITEKGVASEKVFIR